MSLNITLHNPMDMHLHLREGEMLEAVLPFSAKPFSAAVVMPNLKIPITTTALAIAYKEHILSLSTCDFTPLVTLFLTPELTKEELVSAKKAGVRILKLYPKGATTGSEGGVKDILCDKTLQVFALAEELGFILSIHGESNGFCMEREFEFLPIFAYIAEHFPKLRIIIEHLSDRRSLALLEKYDNLFATLTLHHITLSLDDLCGGMLNPHHFCKPMLKTKKDQQALLEAALKAHPKISFGSDSAPHLKSAKLSHKGAAGIFSAPALLPALAELFESHNALDYLQSFVSDRAIAIYDLQDYAPKTITLEKAPFTIPQHINSPLGAIVPFLAGESLSWRIK
ncbi:MAG: dihydroorotase [Helicobacter sp.]|uniref:dihydroorotase n=1 Tax=Helicobacter sp. TaxID=218 RepID=UPI0025C61C1F|nr:dihydroorotase [Helicobacter sp.]MCH5313044.1 dihydroorotase [Helicobacter sp.]